jgi:hypothetical protein
VNTSTITSTITDVAENITSTVTDLTENITSTVNNTVTDAFKRFDSAQFQMPNFQMPNFQMPNVQRPALDMPVDTDRIAEFARDAAYVGVGAIVVVAQQADETARSIAATLSESMSTRVRELVDSIR